MTDTHNQDTLVTTPPRAFSGPFTPLHAAIVGTVFQTIYEAGKSEIAVLRPLLDPLVRLGLITYQDCLGLACACAHATAEREAEIAFDAWLVENTTPAERDSDAAGDQANNEAGIPAFWDTYRRVIARSGYPELVTLAQADVSALDMVKCNHFPRAANTYGAQFAALLYEVSDDIARGRAHGTITVHPEHLLGMVASSR